MIGSVILAHLVGDYLLQPHHMAVRKTSSWLWAIAHGVLYTIPFLFITQSLPALLIIGGTHVIIDRYRLAVHVGWLKNHLFLSPSENIPLDEAKRNAGYPDGTPPWMSTWLMIITDNTMHLLINVLAIVYL